MLSLHKRTHNAWVVLCEVEEKEIMVGTQLWLISGDLKVSMVHDPNADCDADGNRGHAVTFEDERDWTLLTAAKANADDEWEEPFVGDAIPLAVRAAASDWADSYEPPDLSAPDEPDEPDYEDNDD